MHLRRSAKATRYKFISLPEIQIGNSSSGFTAKKSLTFYKNLLQKIATDWRLSRFFKISGWRFFLLWANLLLFTFIVTPSMVRAGQLQNVKITPRDSTAGMGNIYRIDFEPTTGLPKNGKVLIYFPAAFDISSVFVASGVFASDDPVKLDGGFIVSRDSQFNSVTLERDNTGTELRAGVPGTVSVRIAIVGNPTKPGRYDTIRILTQEGDGDDIDERNNVVVIINPGPLDHFNISNIGNQIVDTNFSLSITAKDSYNNNTRAFSGNITLSDNTSTLSPGSVSLTDTSVMVGSAKITKAQGGAKITASAVVDGITRSGISNSFNVNQLKILSIDTTPDKVSRGQKNIEVNMLAQNVGPDVVTLTSAQLNFRRTVGGTSENAFYTVTPPALSTISGASIKTLKFVVNVNTNASFVSVDINGSVTGSVAGGTVSDNDADTKDSWTVQTSPAISYVSNPGLTPVNVSAGSAYEFQVSLRNTGEAALELKPDSTTITFSDGSATFLARLDANRGTTISGGGSDILTFRLSLVPANLQQTTYTPAIKLIGVHNGVRFEQSPSLPNNILTVSAPPSLQIQSVTSLQDVVTQGMRKPWTIKVTVQNNTPAEVNLQQADLSLVQLGTGGGPDADYQIVKPNVFKKSGNGKLLGNATDTLVFQIRKTGSKTGVLGVFAQVLVNELSQPAESNGTQKSILVQTPAALSVTMRTSQATVTAGQTKRWDIIMNVQNNGESEAQALFTNDIAPNNITRTSLSTGYIIAPAKTDIIISGHDFTTIVFNVDGTGAAGDTPTPFDGQVFAKELNSDSLHFTSTSSRIIVQQPAHVRVESMNLVSVFNPDTVNTGQEFFVNVNVKQTVPTNAEKVDSVKVQLIETPASGNASILTNALTLTDLTQPASFKVKAGNRAQVQAGFDASILAAYSANTGANTVKIDGNANFPAPSVYIQRPGALVIDSLKTSESRVRFGRTSQWSIFRFAKNPAAASDGGVIVIDSTRFTFKIGQAVQNDYTIVNTNPADSLFTANRRAMQTFNVTKTGTTGGIITITATIYFHDRNSLTKRSFSKTTTIFVESTALVTIAKTSFPLAVNRLAGTEIALVDTGQVFPINVTVRNTGFEQVKNVVVSLRSIAATNASQITLKKIRVGPIDTESGTAVAAFTVRASATTNNIGEAFTARIDSAYTFGGFAGIAPALDTKDTTAVARIELPARLQLSLVTSDGATAYGFDQAFKIRARVKNLGEAQTDKNGRLTLVRPSGYNFMGNESDTKNFAAGDSIEWNVKTPKGESKQSVFTVRIDNAPNDKNSGGLAQVMNQTAQFTISTLANTLGIFKKSIVDPNGAIDGFISTDQFFTVRIQLNASSNLTNKTIKLMLPNGSGYRFVNGDNEMKSAPSDTARWHVQAPSIENLNPVKLLIDANAFNGQTPVSNLDSLVISRTEKQAILQLDPGIKETGAQNGIVSVGQSFTLVAKLRNTGRAVAAGIAKVQITLPSNITLLEPPAAREKSLTFDQQNNAGELTWRVRAANQPSPQETITFAITQRPLDTNTGLEALTSSDKAPFDVAIVATGIVAADPPRLANPPGARDFILSTDQVFVVSDTLRWTNAANLSAELLLPANANFSVLNNRIQNITNLEEAGKTEVSWVVRAPAGPISNIACRVVGRARDSHNATASLADTSEVLQFNVVRRAELSLSVKITDPPSATDGVLSINQPFTVVATILNAGSANVTGAAEIFLSFPDTAYHLLAPPPQDSLRRLIILPNNACSWRVQARSTISSATDLITVQLTRPPLDENTDALAAINDAEAALAVRTEGRKLIVATADQGGGPAVQGQKNFLLVRLKLINPAGAGASNLMLKTLGFAARKRDGSSVSPGAGAVLKNVYLVNNGSPVGGMTDIPANSQSLQIALSQDVLITPDAPDTVSIFADLADNATGAFRVVFDDGKDLVAIDQEGGFDVAIESLDGKQGKQFRLESNLTALHGAEAENSFFNYPNPFPPGDNLSNGEGTRFSVPLGASGELKIVTMLGELVWETNIDSRQPAGPAIFWSGHNGAGKRVLNGVYVAILKTKDGKMLTTKVAVLKK